MDIRTTSTAVATGFGIPSVRDFRVDLQVSKGHGLAGSIYIVFPRVTALNPRVLRAFALHSALPCQPTLNSFPLIYAQAEEVSRRRLASSLVRSPVKSPTARTGGRTRVGRLGKDRARKSELVAMHCLNTIDN